MRLHELRVDPLRRVFSNPVAYASSVGYTALCTGVSRDRDGTPDYQEDLANRSSMLVKYHLNGLPTSFVLISHEFPYLKKKRQFSSLCNKSMH